MSPLKYKIKNKKDLTLVCLDGLLFRKSWRAKRGTGNSELNGSETQIWDQAGTQYKWRPAPYHESQRMQYKIRYLGHLKAGGEEHTINIPHLAEHDHSYRFFRWSDILWSQSSNLPARSPQGSWTIDIEYIRHRVWQPSTLQIILWVCTKPYEGYAQLQEWYLAFVLSSSHIVDKT